MDNQECKILLKAQLEAARQTTPNYQRSQPKTSKDLKQFMLQSYLLRTGHHKTQRNLL